MMRNNRSVLWMKGFGMPWSILDPARWEHSNPFLGGRNTSCAVVHRAVIACAGLVLSLIFSSCLWAVDPEITRVTPISAQQGTEIELTIAGSRLDDAAELLFTSAGFSVREITTKSGTSLVAKVAVAPDCPVGEHGLRVRTATGISNLITFHVGLLPEIEEKEPNNDFQNPQVIPLNTTVRGVVENEDVDYFAVDLKAGQRLSVEVEGMRLGKAFFDPAVAILDSKRFALAAADDTAFGGQDAVCSAIAPADGRYIVQVRESAFGGSGDSYYRLHVGTFPRPVAAFPLGGMAGQSVKVRWVGDPLGPWEEEMTLPSQPMDRWPVLAHRDGQAAPTPNWMRVSPDGSEAGEVEPNDAPNQATPASAPGACNGVLDRPDDRDFFRFSAKKGQAFDIRVVARQLRTPVDSVLTVHAADGRQLAANDDAGSPDSLIRWTAPDDGEYLIGIRDHLGAGGPDYVYRIEITPVQPKLRLSLPERQQFRDIVAAVPRGNRFAFLVSVTREDFDGPVDLRFEDLPPGISVETFPVPPGQTVVPVILTAAADAPLEGRWVSIKGVSKVGEQEIMGELLQRTSLVRGQNNREYWNFYSHRLATAVTEPVPFQVTIQQPKVPLVQGGTMELTIKAERVAGFDGPITVAMLNLPPGVSAPTSVTIAQGAQEVRMPLTANREAAVGTWKIVALASANIGGTVEVATPPADLTIATPFLVMTFPQISLDQGQSGNWLAQVEVRTKFDGNAQAELLGLPSGIASDPQSITADIQQCTFPLRTEPTAPVGLHKSVIVKVTVIQDGEPVVHLLPAGELRIQKPAPAQVAKAAPPPPPPQPTEKPLSRLEQLRRQRQNQTATP
ncbi:pre-peptidase C-terminal domain-containing protein [Thermogutta sp.]|uniref:pre-peptidase C-terminal domain-containing protein n=1 Tax=Thermogutta sp. TaxID=1962930 RepID=UPI0032203132